MSILFSQKSWITNISLFVKNGSFVPRHDVTKSWSGHHPSLFRLEPLDVFYKFGRIHTNRFYGSKTGKAYPEYALYRDHCALKFKPLPPIFHQAGRNGIAVSRRGSILLEFTPKIKGEYMWKKSMLIALDMEEVGNLLSLFNPTLEVKQPLIFMRRQLDDESEVYNNIEEKKPSKALEVSSDGRLVSFHLGFFLDGKGGQIPPPGEPCQDVTSIKIELTPGEWVVLSNLMKSSIPHISGWKKMQEINTENAVNGIEKNNETVNFSPSTPSKSLF